MAKQATDTFVTVLPDGTERRVMKGEVFTDAHPIVKHAPGLFGDFETGDEKPSARTRGKGN